MGQVSGLPPDLQARFEAHIASSPTPGFGYLIALGDHLDRLLGAAYGSTADAYVAAFMKHNGHLASDAFDDLSRATGQLLYFPLLAQLIEIHNAMNAGQAATGFSAIDQFLAQAGMPPSIYHLLANARANVQGAPPPNPDLQALVDYIMATGNVPGSQRALFNYLQTILAQEIVRGGARDAIREGRTSQGRRGTRPTEEKIDRALEESWTPRKDPVRNGVKPMSQLDYNDTLGNGGATIRNAGCFLTAMAMASTRIAGNSNLDPRSANELVRRGNGFSGSSLVAENAARSLGMRVTARVSGRSTAQLDRNLDAGKPVVVGVHYKGGAQKSDHFITVTGRNGDGSYSAIDPAGGREITLRASGDGVLRANVGNKVYAVTEMVLLDRA